jgi:hypothetical protein
MKTSISSGEQEKVKLIIDTAISITIPKKTKEAAELKENSINGKKQ